MPICSLESYSLLGIPLNGEFWAIHVTMEVRQMSPIFSHFTHLRCTANIKIKCYYLNGSGTAGIHRTKYDVTNVLRQWNECSIFMFKCSNVCADFREILIRFSQFNYDLCWMATQMLPPALNTLSTTHTMRTEQRTLNLFEYTFQRTTSHFLPSLA